HGMCTFGYCGRHVIKAFCNNDGRYFKSIKVRFARSVFPGDTLVTRMWQDSDTRILFETTVKERDEVVIRNAVVELHKQLPVAKPRPTAKVETAPAEVDQGITLEDVFTAIKSYVAMKPELAAQTKTVFQFSFHKPESNWFIDLKNGDGNVGSGIADKPDVTLELDTGLAPVLFGGDVAEVQKLFFGGKLKVSGNVMASNKLAVLAGMDKKMVEEARAGRVAAAGQSAPAAPVNETPAADEGITLADVFGGVAAFIASQPELVKQTGTIFQFSFHHPDTHWFIDLKNGAGAAGAGTAEKADVTLELDTALAPVLFGGNI